MKIWFSQTMLKNVEQIKPKSETMTDFIINAVQERINKLKRESVNNERNKNDRKKINR